MGSLSYSRISSGPYPFPVCCLSSLLCVAYDCLCFCQDCCTSFLVPSPSLPPHLQSFLCNRLKYYDFPKSLILCLFFTRHPYVLLENSVGYSASPPIFFPIYLLNPCLLRTTQTSMLPPRCTSTCPRVHLLLSRRPPFMTSSIKPTPSLYQSASTFHF